MNVFSGIIRVAANAYKSSMRRRLAEYGLKLEDLYVETADVVKALERIDPEVARAREMRIRRAFDLSAKKKSLPTEYQVGDPFELYLDDHLIKAKLEREEREILNHY